ncbi:MAG: homoserine O-acetyltransferase [Puniceicoccales bacterium]|jgi:homoserine O-acetyltransferase|nr:homoserine O-acetyltransferase [Puniceicoccales bacterium]
MTDDESDTAPLEGSDAGLVHSRDHFFDLPFSFELGGTIPAFTLRYETYGQLNAERSNAVLVCHALTGNHHVAGRYTADETRPGWWDAFVGPGRPLDTTRFFVIGVSCLGGCQGSTGPSSANPATGHPYGLTFPQLTMRDMVHAQRQLMNALGISRLHAVIGGSMGGMQGLLWAIDYPDAVQNVVALACAARQGVQAIAFNEVGRNVIVNDPAWLGGAYYGKGPGPEAGLAIARMLGHVSYLSCAGMERKFGRARCAQSILADRMAQAGSASPFKPEFEVEAYLRHQGLSFVKRFDANSYLYITKATDRFDLTEGARSLEDVLIPVRARVSVIGFSSDWLYPPAQNREIATALLLAGKEARYIEVETDAGHDAFLLPCKTLFQAIRQAL